MVRQGLKVCLVTLTPSFIGDQDLCERVSRLMPSQVYRVDVRTLKRGRLKIDALRSPPKHIREYYEYCLHSLLDCANHVSEDKHFQLLWSPGGLNPRNPNQALPTVLLQVEQTIVAEGGRDIGQAPLSRVQLPGSNTQYYARLPGNLNMFAKAAAVIDYSLPNIANILDSELREYYKEKAFYIAPLRRADYKTPRFSPKRNTRVLTVMTKPARNERRAIVLDSLESQGVKFRHVRNRFKTLSRLRKSHRLLLNLGQTSHHHTFPELRILPALLDGMLVLSEDLPCRDEVPYGDYVSFSKTESLGDRLAFLQENYSACWNSVFAPDEFPALVKVLECSNRENFRQIIEKIP